MRSGTDEEGESSPNGIRYSQDKEPFYLLHENQMMALLQRAHAGETPDDLLMENWVEAEKADADEMDEDGISMNNGSAIVLAEVDEPPDEEVDLDMPPWEDREEYK